MQRQGSFCLRTRPKGAFMKKFCILLALLLPAFVLCACVDKPQTQQLSALSVPDLQPDQAAVIVKEGETFLVCTVTLGKDTDASDGEQLLQYLSDEGILSVTWQQSDYGKYLLMGGRTLLRGGRRKAGVRRGGHKPTYRRGGSGAVF